MNTILLQLNNVRQAYGEQGVIHDVSLALQKGQIGCLLGASGCGKTTALRCIAGFERISAGEILLNGTCVSSPDFFMPPEQRQIGMVFQDYAAAVKIPGFNIGICTFRIMAQPCSPRLIAASSMLWVMRCIAPSMG